MCQGGGEVTVGELMQLLVQHPDDTLVRIESVVGNDDAEELYVINDVTRRQMDDHLQFIYETTPDCVILR